RTLDASAHVTDGSGLSHDNVETRFQTTPVHSDRLVGFILSVNLKFLRQDVDDFLAWQHGQFTNLIDENLDIGSANHFISVCTGDVIGVLDAANVLSGNAHDNILYFVT